MLKALGNLIVTACAIIGLLFVILVVGDLIWRSSDPRVPIPVGDASDRVSEADTRQPGNAGPSRAPEDRAPRRGRVAPQSRRPAGRIRTRDGVLRRGEAPEAEVSPSGPLHVVEPAPRRPVFMIERPMPEAERRPNAPASRLEVLRDCLRCPAVVVVPGGRFVMGGAESDPWSDDSERPLRQVQVKRFALGRHEVTRDEYAAFVEATGGPRSPRRARRVGPRRRWGARFVADAVPASGSGCYRYGASGVRARDEEASWREPGFAQDDDHPVVCVSWQDAQAYVRWLREVTGEAYRLPTEAEWEYAARAGTTRAWPWDDTRSMQCGHANGADRTARRRYPGWTVAACSDDAVWTAPAGSYVANGFGLHDMAGNVWEWVADCWHASYQGAPVDGSAWESGGDCGERVLRGGSWYNRPQHLRATVRAGDSAGLRSDGLGFRVARSLN